MSIQWADDFSRYGLGIQGTTAMLQGTPWVAGLLNGNYGPVADPDPSASIGSLCLCPGTTGTGWSASTRMALPTPVPAIRVAARFWKPSFGADPNENPGLFIFATTSNTVLASVCLMPNGAIGIYHGSPVNGRGTLVYETAVPVLTPGAWRHVEAFYDAATGSIDVYVEGIRRINQAGIVPVYASNIGLIGFRPHNTGGFHPVYVKDFVVQDLLGSVNTGVIGTVQVARLVPDSDVTLGDWTPSTGSTAFGILNKNSVNDSTYLSADPDDLTGMEVGFTPLPDDVTSIRAIISVVRGRKIDGGDGNMQVSLSGDGSTWDNGADRPVTTAFTYHFDVSELSPSTTDQWTPIEVNDLVGKITRTL